MGTGRTNPDSLIGVYVSCSRARVKAWIRKHGVAPPGPAPSSALSKFALRLCEQGPLGMPALFSTRIILGADALFLIAQWAYRSESWILVDEGAWQADGSSLSLASRRVGERGLHEVFRIEDGPEIHLPLAGWHPVTYPRYRRLGDGEPTFDPPVG